MKRFAAFLVLAFSASVLAQYGPPPPGNNPWTYGPNSRWDSSWNSRPNPNRGACFYTTAPFRGNKFCVRSGDRLPSLPGNFGDNRLVYPGDGNHVLAVAATDSNNAVASFSSYGNWVRIAAPGSLAAWRRTTLS